MATQRNRYSLVCLLTVCLCAHSFGQTGLTGKPGLLARDTSATQLRERIMEIAKGEIGVVEKTGHNDHPRILIYHRSVSEWLFKNNSRAPYCASFVNYCFKTAGAPVTRVPNPARARDWFAVKSRIVMTQQSLRGNQRMIKPPDKGSVVGYIFYGNAISHVEILDRIDLDEGYIYCVGANTSNRNSANTVEREGQGVYYVKRKIKMFYQIADLL